VRHLPQTRAQPVNADDAIDREIRRYSRQPALALELLRVAKKNRSGTTVAGWCPGKSASASLGTARSPARPTMLRDAATCSTNAREVSDRSASTTTTPSPRITGLRNTAVSTTKTRGARRRPGASRRDRAAAIAARAGRPAEILAWPCASSSRSPVHIGAHARTQLRHLFDRVCPDRERAQIEIASGAGGAPTRIFALGSD